MESPAYRVDRTALPCTLYAVSLQTLLRFKHYLTDIGHVPLELIYPVLEACSAEQLAKVEDATLAGSGRALAAGTWPLWRGHVVDKFGERALDCALPPLPGGTGAAAGPPGQAGRSQPANYRRAWPREDHAGEGLVAAPLSSG